jgi:hypothetical protein
VLFPGVLVIALVGIAVAGCGGSSKSPAVANLGTTGTTGTSGAGSGTSSSAGRTSSASSSRAALATCLRAHGFQAAVGSAGDNESVLSLAGVVVTGNVNPSSPQFQAALHACRKYLPGGGPPALTPAQQAVAAKAMRRFAACMRTHGVSSFPDPNSQGFFAIGSLQAIDRTSPIVIRAFKACESLEAKVGPHLQLG